MVQFIIMEYVIATDKWEVPTTQDFHDLLAALECDMLNKDAPYQGVIKWNNKWGDVGVVGLSAKNIALLKQFRDNLVDFRFQGRYFTSVIKESVMDTTGITVLLRNNLRGYDLSCFARALVRDNPKLVGSVQVHQSRRFGDKDKTRQGESKSGWRLVSLKASALFLQSLEQFPDSHRFKLGSSEVQIRGGRRAPEPPGGGRGGGSSRPQNNATRGRGGHTPRRGGLAP